jgi:uncharacterized membrane protein
MIPGVFLRDKLADLIRRKHPDWSLDQPLCKECLNTLRAEYIEEALRADRGELTDLELGVMRSIQEQELISENTNEGFEAQSTFGQKLADQIAKFGGSWAFIITFGSVLVVWLTLNSVALFMPKPFDPFPFILLNLVLSCLAATQAPVIMMSQNRMEARDRDRAEHDYQVNLKAEMEIRHLHEKVDHLLTHQWERLAEMQQMQMDLMNELSRGKQES